MTNEMSDCPAKRTTEQSVEGASSSAVSLQLPTLQRNALRKIFDRHEFTAEEVASLGYRRLQQAEGIGNKGLAAITEWLKRYGFELQPPEQDGASKPSLPKRTGRNIESAVRLLRTHGYVVQQAGEKLGEGEGAV